MGDHYLSCDHEGLAFESAQQAADYLWLTLQPGETCLLKGSRGLQLETIYNFIKGEN